MIKIALIYVPRYGGDCILMDKSASSDAFSYDNANADVSTDKMREKTSKWEEVADNVAMLILKEFCMNYDEP